MRNNKSIKDVFEKDWYWYWFVDQVFDYSEYKILQKEKSDSLELEQIGADFEFLTKTDYKTDQDKIVIENIEQQLPILIKLNKPHELNDNYIWENSILAITKLDLAPRFYEIKTISTQDHQETQIQSFYDTEDSLTLTKKETTFDYEIDINSQIELLWYKRNSNPDLTIKISPDNQWTISQSWSGGNLVLDISQLKKDKKYLISISFQENNKTYIYDMNFPTIADFAVTKKWQSKSEKLLWTEYTNEYTFCLTQPIDEESLDENLQQIFGSGKFITTSDENYADWYWYGLSWSEKNCVSFVYFNNPDEEKTYTLKSLKSIYWETIDIDISILPYKIHEHQKSLNIVGSPVNVIPLKWADSNKVQLIHQNTNQWKIYYRTCSFVKQNTQNITENFLNDQYSNYDSPNQLISNFLYCLKTQTKELDFKNSEPRKEYVYDINLKEIFPDRVPEVFEISTKYIDDSNPGMVFIRSDIWVLAKYSNQKLYAWANSLKSWNPLYNLDYSIIYFDRSDATLKSEQWKFSKNFSYDFTNEIWFGMLYLTDWESAWVTFFPEEDFYSYWDLSNWNNGYYKNRFALDNYAIWAYPYWWNNNLYKIFAYTDRVLYKPGGEDIFVSGWIRKNWNSKNPNWQWTITLYDPEWNSIQSNEIWKLDEFGGFKTNFSLWESAKLWTYRIWIEFIHKDWENSYFDNYVQVQEFKKSSIDVQTEFISWVNVLKVSPKYYFGQALSTFDFSASYSLVPERYWIYDRSRCWKQWCETSIYYSNVEKFLYESGWYISHNNFEGEYFNLDLNFENTVPSNLNIDLNIKDKTTQESTTRSIMQKVLPEYLVWIEWWSYNRKNKSEKYNMTGRVLEKVYSEKDLLENYELSNSADSVDIEVYYKDFENNQEEWPDWELYYTTRWSYKKIDTLFAKVDWWIFTKEISFDKSWDYLLKVVYKWKYENDQVVYVYDRDYGYFYGNMDNNYTLELFVNEKEYEFWESVEVNIDPYIKWANSILTVEKDWEILYQKEQKLDGSPLSFVAQREYYPNSHVSVAMIAGEDINSQISDRKEPRFMIWYKNVNFSPKMMWINFDVKLTNTSWENQEYYKPGQKVKIQIATTDYQNKPLKTRLSVGVVDKALIDIYDLIRQPLINFYTYSSPGFFVSANYHLIFKALKVLSEDWSKWGGGWEWDSMDPIAPRKKFMDLAMWKWGVITDELWNIEIEFELPDNLTTWVVDIIWLWKWWEMSTYRQNFVVSKDVIMSVYLPRFITPYTTVEVPVSVIVNNKNISEPQIMWNISIEDFSQKLEIQKNKDGYFFELSIDSIPLDKIINNDYIKLTLQANQDDSVELSIPIRKENMFIEKYVSYKSKSIDEKIVLENNAKVAKVDVVVSTIPVSQLSNAVSYLLRYPYGCTEQLLSSLYPTLVAKDLAKRWFLEQWLISGDWVNYHWNWQRIDEVLADTFEKIYKNQNSQWLFGYWNWDQEWNLWLSIYVYNVLSYAKNLWYSVDLEKLDLLESALNNFGDVRTQLYYMMQKAILWEKVNLPQVDELLSKDSSRDNMVMAYVIKAYKKQNTDNLFDKIISNQSLWENYYFTYTDSKILKAYLVRALVKEWKLEKADAIVQELLSEITNRGYRWGSTQRNMQIIIAMKEFVEAKTFDNKTISAKLVIDWQEFNTDLWEQSDWNWISYQKYSFEKNNVSELAVSMNSDKELYLNVKVSYVPQKLDNFQDQWSNVSNFKLSDLSLGDFEKKAVWETIKIKWSFEVSKEANELAVVYNIPAFSYIINKIWEQANFDYRRWYYEGQDSKSIQFKTTKNLQDWYSCYPDHYEVRFDKLFLYYDNLPTGAGCEVEFSLMKTHNGSIEILHHNLFEMYWSEVWQQTFQQN